MNLKNMSLLVHPQKTVHEQIAKMKSRIIQNRMQKKRENREKVVIINSFDAGFDCLVQFKNRKNSKKYLGEWGVFGCCGNFDCVLWEPGKWKIPKFPSTPRPWPRKTPSQKFNIICGYLICVFCAFRSPKPPL
jgi:hypothetical protein